MTLISYVALENYDRGNKLLREFNYIKNDKVDIFKISYQNSTVKLFWKCELCGKEFTSLLNNRVGHTLCNCACYKKFYVTSTSEELISLVLRESLTCVKTQVPLFPDKRKRVDILLNNKIIIEYDGVFHDEEKDSIRDIEAKNLGYTTIRIIEVAPYPQYQHIQYTDKDRAAYDPVLNRYTIFANYYKYDSNLQAMQIALVNLQDLLLEFGIDINVPKVTNALWRRALEKRIVNKRR